MSNEQASNPVRISTRAFFLSRTHSVVALAGRVTLVRISCVRAGKARRAGRDAGRKKKMQQPRADNQPRRTLDGNSLLYLCVLSSLLPKGRKRERERWGNRKSEATPKTRRTHTKASLLLLLFFVRTKMRRSIAVAWQRLTHGWDDANSSLRSPFLEDERTVDDRGVTPTFFPLSIWASFVPSFGAQRNLFSLLKRSIDV